MIKSKLLSDAAWKDVAAKNKVKDNGLLKALEKLKRVGDDDHDEATKVLDEIGKLAGLLKKDKAIAAVTAAAKYITEMLGAQESASREVAKAKAEHDKAQKAKADAEKKAAAKAADEDDEEDEEESPELLTTKLKPLLKLVNKGETMHALLAKSGKKVVVMLSRKPISPSRRKMLFDELGGGSTKYYPGVCSREGGATTFTLKSEVAGMSKLVKLALLEQTGLRLNKIKCRGDDGDDDDDDGGDDEAPAPADKADGEGELVAKKNPAEKSPLAGGDALASDSGAPGGAGAPGSAPAPPSPGACATPDATATDCFFDHDSADLTPSDKTFLEAYAKSYLGSKSTATITLEGFASVDGDKKRNDTLAKDRAERVASYLVAQKVPKDMVKHSGMGPTDRFPGTLCENRRVTLAPKLDLKVRDFVEVVEEEPRNVPIPGKKPSDSLGEKAEEADIANIPLPQPPEMVTREEVRDALEAWLRDLGKSQKVKARNAEVMSTNRVHVAEQTLHGRPRGEDTGIFEITPKDGDRRGYPAGELADKIARNLPEQIPKVNFDLFKKMHAAEVQPEKPVADQIGDKLDKKADEVLEDFKVPKKYWQDIKDAVKKRARDAIDKLPVDDSVKDLAKQAYDKIDKSGEDK